MSGAREVVEVFVVVIVVVDAVVNDEERRESSEEWPGGRSPKVTRSSQPPRARVLEFSPRLPVTHQARHPASVLSR